MTLGIVQCAVSSTVGLSAIVFIIVYNKWKFCHYYILIDMASEESVFVFFSTASILLGLG